MQQYEHYFAENQHAWNLRTGVHKNTDFYDVEGWKQGRNSLTELELREVGNVAGKRLLHLQCHFGQDTLSWARLGAQVTGCDFSNEAIHYAQTLAAEMNLNADFVCCNVYDLPKHLSGQYDIVFSSFGVVGWLPELEPWAKVIAHFLKPGGYFYLAEFHPVVWMLDDDMMRLRYAYHNAGVIETESQGTYADRYASIQYKEFGWNHSLSEVINSLLNVGLQLAFLNEYPHSPFNCFSNTVLGDDGYYRIRGLEDIIPLVYSLRVNKPL